MKHFLRTSSSTNFDTVYLFAITGLLINGLGVIEVRSREFMNPGDTCFFARSRGDCSLMNQKWYFDSQRLTCLTFTFSGCNGNFNNFQSEAECLNACYGFKLPFRLRTSDEAGAKVELARKEPFEAADARIGQRINLLCTASIGPDDPEIEHCKWTKPPIPTTDFNITENHVYENRSFVFPSRTSLDHHGYSFYGRGLADGECGLTIHSVHEEDFGFWSCLIVRKQRKFNGIVAFKAAIQVGGTLQSEGEDDSLKKLGIGIGIFLSALIVLVAIGLLMWARKTDKWCFQKEKNRGKGESTSYPEEATPAIPMSP